MSGKLFGIGIGPGDYKLMTLYAVELIKDCEVLVLPSENKESCLAYNITKMGLPEVENKECIFWDFPMTKDESSLRKAQVEISQKIIDKLELEKNVAFLTLGDPSVYSTFTYINKIVKSRGYVTEIISGVSSFCAAANVLGISLGEKNKEIHIIPASYNLENSFDFSGTLVFMKSGKKILELKNFLLEKKESYDFEFYGISNCGFENQKIYSRLEQLDEAVSYLTILIVKNIKKKIEEKNYKFFQNKNCEMFPCHPIENPEEFNCLFCYCPLYFLRENCGGDYKFTSKGKKSCIDCSFPHKKSNYDEINRILKEKY